LGKDDKAREWLSGLILVSPQEEEEESLEAEWELGKSVLDLEMATLEKEN